MTTRSADSEDAAPTPAAQPGHRRLPGLRRVADADAELVGAHLERPGDAGARASCRRTTSCPGSPTTAPSSSPTSALFVPVGLFLLLLFGTRLWWVAGAAAIALTSAIELAQRSIPGRVPDERDIAANTLGAIIGIVIGVVLTLPATLRRTRDARARRERDLARSG